jgi:NAD(P)-dependent dehydrogenase (short-subunit alcohol dehydrogenase family)
VISSFSGGILINPTSDKIVVITGATSGLGLETAKTAAREGWRIGFVARSRDRGEAARDRESARRLWDLSARLT